MKLLATQTAYTPNEADLTIAALQTYLTGLTTVILDVNNAAKELAKARRERNVELYKEKTGAVDIALRVKEYVKGMTAAGAGSAEYKRIRHIKFKDLALTESESR